MTSRIFLSLLFLVCLFGASFALTFVNSCQELNIEDETYEMNVALLNNDSVCFRVTADGITLDCKGGTINYTGPGSNSHTAVLVDNSDDFTLLNCRIENYTSSSAVILNTTGEAWIRNLTTTQVESGVRSKLPGCTLHLLGSSLGFTYAGTITEDNLAGLFVEGCTFDGGISQAYGITAGAGAALIRNNLFNSIGRMAIRLSGEGEFQIYNNTFFNCGTKPAYPTDMVGGIAIRGHNSMVWNNTVRDGGGVGYIDGYSIATDNTFHSNIVYNMTGGFKCDGSPGHISYNNSAWDIEKVGFQSNCRNAAIFNNTVRNASTGFMVEMGVSETSGDYTMLYENLAFESKTGFEINFPPVSGWMGIEDNSAHSNNVGFLFQIGGSPDQDVPVQDNLAWNNSIAGYQVSPSDAIPELVGNDAWNNTIGVYFYGSEGGVFSGANIYENQVGALFQEHSEGTLSDCDVYSNTNPTFTGVGAAFVEKSSQNLIEGSRFYDNNFGVFMNESSQDGVSGCDFYEVDGLEETRYGVFMTSFVGSPLIEDSDFYDFDSAVAPFGVGIHYAGNSTVSPNITMRGLRIYNLGGAGINLVDFAENLDEPIPAFTLEDSYLYNTKGIPLILRGDTGQITDTYVFTPRSDILDVAGFGGEIPATPSIQANNLGIGLPDSALALGVGADATRYAYIVYPAIVLTRVILSDVALGTNFASLNASGNATNMDTDARVHLQPNMCSGLKYYFLDGYPTTFEDIMEFGAEFTPTSKTCTGGWADFAVDHFTGYAANGTPSTPSQDGGGEPEEGECDSDSDCTNSCYYCNLYGECTLLSTSECAVDSDCEGMVGQAITPFGHTIQLSYICENCQCVGYECTPDSPCPSGYTCEGGNCIPPDCFVDLDCASGYECSNYNCVKEAAEEPEEEPSETGGIGEEPLPEEEVEQPPFPKPAEIVKEVLPFVEGTEPEEPEDGIWETVVRGGWILLLVLILIGIFYALVYRKKKKKE